MWQAKMKEICSSQRRKAQDWSGELLKCRVKTRSSLWWGQSLCCTFHHCSHVLLCDVHLPWQGLSLGLGRTRTMSKSATACGLQLRQPLRGLNWVTAPNTVLGHNQTGSWSRSSLDDEILLWVKMLIFPGRQCYTRHVCSSFTATGCFSQALLSSALGSLWQLLKGWSCTVAKYSSCSSCSDWTFFLEPQPLG